MFQHLRGAGLRSSTRFGWAVRVHAGSCCLCRHIPCCHGRLRCQRLGAAPQAAAVPRCRTCLSSRPVRLSRRAVSFCCWRNRPSRCLMVTACSSDGGDGGVQHPRPAIARSKPRQRPAVQGARAQRGFQRLQLAAQPVDLLQGACMQHVLLQHRLKQGAGGEGALSAPSQHHSAASQPGCIQLRQIPAQGSESASAHTCRPDQQAVMRHQPAVPLESRRERCRCSSHRAAAAHPGSRQRRAPCRCAAARSPPPACRSRG
jgi:hypothetical protein